MLNNPILEKLWRDRKGSSFVEMTMLVPFVLLLCCGTMDFARVVYAGIEVANATRAGVQFGALNPGNSGDFPGMVQAALADAADLGAGQVTATARNFCGCKNGTTEVSCTDATACSGTTPSGYVAVTTNYNFNPMVPWPGMPGTIALTRTAKMRVQ